MITTTMTGLSGTNPQTFLAMVGLLRVANARNLSARLAFSADGSFHPIVVTDAEVDWPAMITEDAQSASGPQPWRLEYPKEDKGGSKLVADLKAPTDAFLQFLKGAREEWLHGRPERADFAAAYGTSVAKDGKGNTKPTAFHFTAANQQFLGGVELARAAVTSEWTTQALIDIDSARPGPNLRWDPAADRSYALMAQNPNADGTSGCAPMEWLAFRGLPAFPSCPRGQRIMTAGVTGRGNAMRFTWPLWSTPHPLGLVRRMVVMDWSKRNLPSRRLLSVTTICTSEIRRTGQGFGNFGPSVQG